MRVPLSTGLWHSLLRSSLTVLRHVVGSGAIESRSYGCVTLHAVGPGARSRTIMPNARGVAPARRDPPETRRRCATKEEDGRAPRIAAGECCRWQFLSVYAATVVSARISAPAGITPVSA